MSSHSHSAADTIQIDDPEAGSTWFISLAGSIIFVAIVLALCVLYFQVTSNYEATVAVNVPIAEVENAKTAQKAKLATPGEWIEESPGAKQGEVVQTKRSRITIDDAMKLVGAELSGAAPAGGSAK
jgi:hypothetical protein